MAKALQMRRNRDHANLTSTISILVNNGFLGDNAIYLRPVKEAVDATSKHCLLVSWRRECCLMFPFGGVKCETPCAMLSCVFSRTILINFCSRQGQFINARKVVEHPCPILKRTTENCCQFYLDMRQIYMYYQFQQNISLLESEGRYKQQNGPVSSVTITYF